MILIFLFLFQAYNSAAPGDWDPETGICKKKSERYKSNLRKLKKGNKSISEEFTTYVKLYNQMFDDERIQKKPSFDILFKNIKYHFINLHKLGVFKTFPSHDKIIYIGGIHVESKGILTEPKAAANEE